MSMSLYQAILLSCLLASVVTGSNVNETEIPIEQLLSEAAGCNVNETKIPIEQLLSEAAIVVSGKDVFHAPLGDGGPQRNFTFDVYCVYKEPEDITIPTEIFLLDVGTSDCSGTDMTKDKQYILALKQASLAMLQQYGLESSEAEKYYTEEEPGSQGTAAFEATVEQLNITTRLCAVEEVKSLGSSDPSNDPERCPAQREDTDDACIRSDNTINSGDKLVSLAYVSLSMIVVTFKWTLWG